MKGILERQWSRKNRYVMKWRLMEFTHLGNRVSAGGGCEASVTARTICGWVKCKEFGKLQCGRRFILQLTGAVWELCKASNTVWK